MFGLKREIKLKQARNALRDGRLDEAHAIVTDRDIRDHWGAQSLLQELATLLLNRGREHFEGGRLREALLDVERSIDAGGNHAGATELRKQVLDAMAARKQMVRNGRELVESARARLERGSLRAGKDRLDDAPSDEPGVAQLRRQVDDRTRQASEAQEQLAIFLDEDALEASVEVALRAIEASGRKDGGCPGLLLRLKKRLLSRMEELLMDGNLGKVTGLHGEAQAILGTSSETSSISHALSLTEKAVAAIRKSDYEAARVALGRLREILPGCDWVEENLKHLDTVTASLREILSGPLGLIHSRAPGAMPNSHTVTRVLAPAAGGAPVNEPRPASPGRLLLWVDGVGTYLILSSDRTSIGRRGSSAHPDISLSAPLSGHHAEVLRIEDDYFVVAVQGEVEVNGKNIDRKLLANGDSIYFCHKTRATFELPTSLSNTAVLRLHRSQKVSRDVREIILLDRDLVLGTREHCHVKTALSGPPVVISRRADGLYCRSEDDIRIDGKSVGTETPVPLDAHIQVGELTFTLTEDREDGEPR